MTALSRRWGIEVPVIQAPMAGGPSTVALAAAVSDAGGLGSLAGGYSSADRLRADIAAMRAATDRPFAVNLFVLDDAAATGGRSPAVPPPLAALKAELDVDPGLPERWAEPFSEQSAVLVEEAVPVASFAFEAPPPDLIEALHRKGTFVIGTATNVAEAEALEDAGCDAVVAQGGEAGGHHGSWLVEATHSVVGTMALVPLVCDAVSVPVIAAGGIVDGRGVAAALCLGAEAAQMGTAFLRCPEAGTPAPHRRAVTGAKETDVALTSEVTGKLARGVRNRLMQELRGVEVPPYPVMHALSRPLRAASAAADDPSLMSLWCGQGAPLATDRPAAEVVAAVAADLARLLPGGGC